MVVVMVTAHTAFLTTCTVHSGQLPSLGYRAASPKPYTLNPSLPMLAYPS